MAKPAKTLQQKANEAADRIEDCGRSTIEAVHECGLILLEMKESLTHGEFGPWLETGFKHGDRQARRYMAIAKTDLVAVLNCNTIHEALKISSPKPSDKKPAVKPASKPSEPAADIDPETPIQSPADDGVEYEDDEDSDDDILPIVGSTPLEISEPEKLEKSKVKHIVRLLEQIENRMYALKEIVATLDAQERQVLGFLLEARHESNRI